MSEQSLSIWNDAGQVAEIKKLIAPTLTDQEFELFKALGVATGLNPFLGELYATKYENKKTGIPKLAVFVGKNGYLKSGVNDPEYDYHYSDTVYEGDDFQIVDGEVRHTQKGWGMSKKLIGAYTVVKRKSSSKPIVVKVLLREYEQMHGVWPGKKETMIKKVSLSQAFREAFPGRFNGTYDESEQWEDPELAKKPRVKVVASTKEEIINPKPAEVVAEKPKVVLSEVGEQFGKMLNAYLTMCGKDRAATLNGLGERFQVSNWGAVTDDTYTAMMATLEALSKEEAEAAIDSALTPDIDTPPMPPAPPVTNQSLADKINNF